MIIDLDSWEAGHSDALLGRPSSFDQVSYSSGYARLMHTAQNCRRPFACAIPNARALAALGLSSFKIFNYLNERIPLDQFANEVARVWRMPCRTAPGPAIGAEGSAGRT